jgi:hypothetical protein
MKKTSLHMGLAAGRWHRFSLAAQLGNIGSEVSRAAANQGKDEKRFWGAVERGLELFDMTLADKRWRARLKEIGRAREVFCDAVLGGREYGSTLADLDRYFTYFALSCRK